MAHHERAPAGGGAPVDEAQVVPGHVLAQAVERDATLGRRGRRGTVHVAGAARRHRVDGVDAGMHGQRRQRDMLLGHRHEPQRVGPGHREWPDAVDAPAVRGQVVAGRRGRTRGQARQRDRHPPIADRLDRQHRRAAPPPLVRQGEHRPGGLPLGDPGWRHRPAGHQLGPQQDPPQRRDQGQQAGDAHGQQLAVVERRPRGQERGRGDGDDLARGGEHPRIVHEAPRARPQGNSQVLRPPRAIAPPAAA